VALSSAFPWLPISWYGTAIMAMTISLFAIRAGLLPLIVGFTFCGIYTSFPLQLGQRAWYSEATVLGLGITALATFYGLRAATRPGPRA